MNVDKKINKRDLMIFGLIWALIFSLIAFFPVINGGEVRVWSAIVSGCFACISLAVPQILKYFYIIWVKFGNVVGKINSFIIIGVLFFIIFTPFGVIMRLLGKDLLSKKIDKSSSSYWVTRDGQPSSMKNQF